jgi:hypothetical protein
MGRMGMRLGRRVISFVKARDVGGEDPTMMRVWQGQLELRAMEHEL